MPTATAPSVTVGDLALLIPVGSDTYAVPLEDVREVVVGPA